MTGRVCLSPEACKFYLLEWTCGSGLVLGYPNTSVSLSHLREIFVFTYQNDWDPNWSLFPISKQWCRNAAEGTPFLCHQGTCFYYVPLATSLHPVLLSPSLLGNCLDEPYEETPPIPCPTGVGRMWVCHLVCGSRCLPMGNVLEQKPGDAFSRLQHHVKASSWLPILPFIDRKLTSASSI